MRVRLTAQPREDTSLLQDTLVQWGEDGPEADLRQVVSLGNTGREKGDVTLGIFFTLRPIFPI